MDILDYSGVKFSPSLLSQQISQSRYYCPKKPTAFHTLDVICAGWEACLGDYHLKRPTFSWLAIELVSKGEGWLRLNGRKFRLSPGSVFCYGPGVAHEIISDQRRPLEKYFVDFSGREARRLLAASQITPGTIRHALYPHELQELFEHLLFEGNREMKQSSSIAVSYLRLLLQKVDQCARTAGGQGKRRSLASYLRAKSFLEENYRSLTTVEDAARQLAMTPETFCRLFRRFLQTSPYQYLLHLRLRDAVDLLLGSNLLIKEIAQAAGFSDPFHFSRLFKGQHGVSPEVFRARRQR